VKTNQHEEDGKWKHALRALVVVPAVLILELWILQVRLRILVYLISHHWAEPLGRNGLQVDVGRGVHVPQRRIRCSFSPPGEESQPSCPHWPSIPKSL
jgi:hypothetical protein